MKKIAVGDLGEFWYGDYKEPFVQLEGAIPGYPQGVILKRDDGKLLCPFCVEGKTYNNLGAHAAKAHGLRAPQFKDEVGLLRSSALVSEQTRQLNSAQGIRRRLQGTFHTLSRAESRAGGLLGAQVVRHAERGGGSPERLNKTGRCYAQIIATAKTIQLEYGRITIARMNKHGIYVRNVERYFGTWQTFLRAVKDSTVRRAGIAWSDSQLITALRSLAQEIGHTPTVSDQTRYGIPTRHAYEHHFGSWAEACRRAGIAANVPGQWARRAITDQEEIAVLSGYAMSGTMGRAAKAAGISWQRATAILTGFGIKTLPGESPLRRGQMATAATIARRIAGWPDEEEAA